LGRAARARDDVDPDGAASSPGGEERGRLLVGAAYSELGTRRRLWFGQLDEARHLLRTLYRVGSFDAGLSIGPGGR
jgi:hypothetical protein